TFFVKLIIICIDFIGGVHTIITENKTGEMQKKIMINNFTRLYKI
ncbi:uncharacterized protein METZ01_LOCUS170460, partial [marine metagenome]